MSEEEVEARNLALNLKKLRNKSNEDNVEASDTDRFTLSAISQSNQLFQEIQFKTVQNLSDQRNLPNSLTIEKSSLFQFNSKNYNFSCDSWRQGCWKIKSAMQNQRIETPVDLSDYPIALNHEKNNKKAELTKIRISVYRIPSQNFYSDFEYIDLEDISGIFLLFSLNSQESFQTAKNFIEQQELELSKKLIFLIGTKSDLERQTTQSENIQFASQHQLKLFEISMDNEKDVNNIVKAFVKFFI